MDRYYAISFVVFFISLFALAALFYEDIKASTSTKTVTAGKGSKEAASDSSDEEVYYVYIEPIDFAVNLSDGRLSRFNIEPTIEVYNKKDQELIEKQKPRIIDTFIQVLYNPAIMINVLVNDEIDMHKLMSVLQQRVTEVLFPNKRTKVLVRGLERGRDHGGNSIPEN